MERIDEIKREKALTIEKTFGIMKFSTRYGLRALKGIIKFIWRRDCIDTSR